MFKVLLLREIIQMKKFFSSIPNRLLSIYLIWGIIHFVLFLLGRSFDYHSNFFPFSYIHQGWALFQKKRYVLALTFDLQVYDYTEFIIYLIVPASIYISIKLWFKKDMN